MKVERWDLRREGPPTEAALRRKLEGLGYEVDAYRYPPGTFFDTHTHAVDKIDAVVSGSFRVTMDEGSVVLGAGDAVWVPKGTPHSAEVVGDLPVVSLDAIKVR
jgi:mannose-6-phosphate isomerase-like protein (cupin superfamily)